MKPRPSPQKPHREKSQEPARGNVIPLCVQNRLQQEGTGAGGPAVQEKKVSELSNTGGWAHQAAVETQRWERVGPLAWHAGSPEAPEVTCKANNRALLSGQGDRPSPTRPQDNGKAF